MLKMFLSQRKNKNFIVKEVPKKQMTENLINTVLDYSRELCYLLDVENGIIGFAFEESDIYTFILELTLNTRFSLENLYFVKDHIKLSNDEIIIIDEFIYTLEEIIRIVMFNEIIDHNYSKFFNIEKIVDKCEWEIYPTN